VEDLQLDITIRVYAAEAIGRIGLQNAATGKQLEPLLRDKNRYVRARIAQALINGRFAADSAIAVIVDLIRSNDDDVRLFVLGVIKELQIMPEPLKMELRKFISDPDPEMRTAVRALLHD
jgi:HEAT repeat protein